MAPPWGSAGESVVPAASSRLPRRSVAAPSMFPEASKKQPKNKRLFGTFFNQCWLHLGSLFAPFFHLFSTWGEKGEFMKISVSCTRELNFRGSKVSTSSQKASQPRSKSPSNFDFDLYTLFDSKMNPKSTQIEWKKVVISPWSPP